MTAADSGTPECPITYRAQAGAEVRLLGGRELKDFTSLRDAAVVRRLDQNARGHVLQADLKAAGVADFGRQDWNTGRSGAGLELFYHNRPMTLARWPNQGFTPIVDVAGPIEKNSRGQDMCREGRIVYEGDRPSRWLNEPDGWVHGYWFHDWSDQRHPIASIDPDRHVLAVKPPYHTYGYRKDRWFYAFNLLPELDSPGVGVYLDDILSGQSILGNVFYKVTRAAFIGGGRDNLVENNIFVDCKPALHIDARGMGVKFNYGATTHQPLRLKEMPYKQSPWKERYPELVGMLEDEPEKPKNNRVVRNICVGGRWDEVAKQARPLTILEPNFLQGDPLFVNADKQDFRLRSESPAWQMGFKPIPVEKIGLYKDEFRASWPVRHEPLPEYKAATPGTIPEDVPAKRR